MSVISNYTSHEKLDKNDELKLLREEFHFPESNPIYLCGHSLGLQPKNAYSYVKTELDSWKNFAVEGHMHGDNPWLDYHSLLNKPMSKIVGSKYKETVVMNSLTTNLHLLMISFFKPSKYKNKIIIDTPAFPSDKYAVQSQLKLHGLNPEKNLIEINTLRNNKCISKEEMLEQWVTSLVEKNNRPEISKKNFIKTIKENLTKPIIGTEAQNDSFKTVVEIGEEMEPVMMVNIDGFDDDGHLNGYLKSDQSDDVIELNICPSGNIKLNGMNVGETELVETDRDDEGEYIGAPEATTAPVKTPTIAPTKPGEKKRRGPFQKPKVKPKPKAGKGDESPLPDWLTSTNLGKALTQHG